MIAYCLPLGEWRGWDLGLDDTGQHVKIETSLVATALGRSDTTALRRSDATGGKPVTSAGRLRAWSRIQRETPRRKAVGSESTSLPWHLKGASPVSSPILSARKGPISTSSPPHVYWPTIQ